MWTFSEEPERLHWSVKFQTGARSLELVRSLEWQHVQVRLWIPRTKTLICACKQLKPEREVICPQRQYKAAAKSKAEWAESSALTTHDPAGATALSLYYYFFFHSNFHLTEKQLEVNQLFQTKFALKDFLMAYMNNPVYNK